MGSGDGGGIGIGGLVGSQGKVITYTPKYK